MRKKCRDAIIAGGGVSPSEAPGIERALAESAAELAATRGSAYTDQHLDTRTRQAGEHAAWSIAHRPGHDARIADPTSGGAVPVEAPWALFMAAPRPAFTSPSQAPGADLVGRDSLDAAREAIRGAAQPTKETLVSRRAASAIADAGQRMESSDSVILRVAGRALQNAFVLGNLPGQNIYLALRAQAAGAYQRASDLRDRLVRLRKTMSEQDLEQFRDYMMTRGADPGFITREDVRDAAQTAKSVFNALGGELVRLGLMDQRQFNRYEDRYLPRAYWAYIEKELAGGGIKIGRAGYLRQRGGSSEARLIGTAIDALGQADAVETIRQEVTGMLDGLNESRVTDVKAFMIEGDEAALLRAASASAAADKDAWAQRMRDIRAELTAVEQAIQAADLISLAPQFMTHDPDTGKPLSKTEAMKRGPIDFVDRYGPAYVRRVLVDSASQGLSIGAMFEQASLDGIVQDPILLSARGIAVQVRDMAIYKFFDAIYSFTEAQRAELGQADMHWLVPGSIVKFRGRLYSLPQLREAIESLERYQGRLEPGSITRLMSEDMLREARQLYDDNKRTVDGFDRSQFVQLPSTPAYGSLAGAYVHKAIARDLRGSLGDQSFGEGNPFAAAEKGFLANIGAFFKQTKTTLNVPAGHARALVGNLSNAYMAGVGNSTLGSALGFAAGAVMGGAGAVFAPATAVLPAYVRALRAIREDAPDWQRALSLGVKQGTFTAIEIRAAMDAVQEIREAELDDTSGKGPLRVMGSIVRGVRSGMSSAADVYNFWDTTARFMIFREMLAKGMGETDAMAEAMRWMPDYSLVPDWVRAMRNNFAGVMVAPFITYTYKLTPVLADQVERIVNPASGLTASARMDSAVRLAPFFVLASGIANAVTMMLVGLDDDEAKALRETVVDGYRQNPTRIFHPWRNSQQDMLQSTIDWLFAWTGPLHAVGQAARGDVAGALGAGLGWGSPLYNIVTVWNSGVDPFSGSEWWSENDSEVTKFASSMKYMVETLFVPPFLVGAMDPLWEAAGANPSGFQGAASLALDRLAGDTLSKSGKYVGDWPQIVARFAGLNVTSHNSVARAEAELRSFDWKIRDQRQRIGIERRRVQRAQAALERDTRMSEERRETIHDSLEEEFERFQDEALERIAELHAERDRRARIMEPIIRRESGASASAERPDGAGASAQP